MAIKRLSGTGIVSGSAKSSKLWDQETAMGTYETIASAIVDSSNASTVTFSSIPQNYNHLQLRFFGRMNRADDADGLTLRFNGDTGSNYTVHILRGDGSSASSYAETSQSYMYITPDIAANNPTSGIYGTAIIDILEYTNTSKLKTVRCLSGNDRNGSGAVGLDSGFWFKAGSGVTSDAITSITLGGRYGSGFIQYSHFALYGIRG